MTTFTLDTHATIKELVTAGMESRQAEAVVAAISRRDAELVTKDYLKHELAQTEMRLVKWAVALVALAVVLNNFLGWIVK